MSVEQEASVSPRAGTGQRILIVDDDQTNRRILRSLLAREGYPVVEAQNGLEAVECFEREQPDMILMDIMMPVMDGYDATRAIKAIAGERFVPVIFLTALLDEQSLAKCVECGGDDFLTKPYNRVILKAKMAALQRVGLLYSTLKQQKDELAQHHERLQHEHEVAERVFAKVVQSGNLDMENLRYYVAPMAIANGDMVLAAKRPGGGSHIMLGDFTGHGLSAALGAIPVSDIFYNMTASGFSIQEIAVEINRKLQEKLPTGLFLAACLLGLDADEQTLHVWNSGLPDVLVYGVDRRLKSRIPSRHLPLGVSQKLEKRTDTIELAAGDRIFAYSDGVIEACNSAGELFSETRLLAYFEQDTPAEKIFQQILDGLESFRADAPQSDDIALVEITARESSTEGAATQTNAGAQWQVECELGPAALRAFDVPQLFTQLLEQMPGLNEHRARIYTVFVEMYSNALEHGLLGLSSREKRTADGFDSYYDQRSGALMALQEGAIRVRIGHKVDNQTPVVTITIEDTGPGIDWQKVEWASDAKAGRGIALVEKLCERLDYDPQHNRLEAVYRCG